MTTTLTTLKGEKALLLAEACKLNKEKKATEKRLKEIKDKLVTLKVGSYKNQANDSLVVSEIEAFTEINPKTVFDYLKRNQLMASFQAVVKVQITPLKKVVSETVIKRWRKPLDAVKRMTFK